MRWANYSKFVYWWIKYHEDISFSWKWNLLDKKTFCFWVALSKEINIVKSNISFDLVFIDGNHRYEATLKYFELLKNNLSDSALVIFDDIHWSSGMRRAWQEICSQKGIVFSINFFKLGIIVFDPKQSKPTDDHYQLFLSLWWDRYMCPKPNQNFPIIFAF